MSDTIAFTAPLPPPALRSNSRSGWRTKMGARQAYSKAVYGWFMDQYPEAGVRLLGLNGLVAPLKRAHVTYTWRHAGVAPDIGNIGSNVKALQDILCMAPTEHGQAECEPHDVPRADRGRQGDHA